MNLASTTPKYPCATQSNISTGVTRTKDSRKTTTLCLMDVVLLSHLLPKVLADYRLQSYSWNTNFTSDTLITTKCLWGDLDEAES